ncbi:hypothetical protein LguiB_005817 [Lonicera macranthoides]
MEFSLIHALTIVTDLSVIGFISVMPKSFVDVLGKARLAAIALKSPCSQRGTADVLPRRQY